MRSSKSRSRSKSNRSRSVGNIVNRVFDSSGPEGKVRGTPQQIIDKYTQLARDATLSNDRVAAENFQQHAEHYTRMLGEAMREQEARREQQEAQQNQQNQPRQQNDRPQRDGQSSDADEGQQEAAQDSGTVPSTVDVIDVQDDQGDSGLVETPEASAPKPRRPRGRGRAKAQDAGGDAPEAGSGPEAGGAGPETEAKAAE